MQAAIQNVDCVIEARWVIPVEPAETVLEHHAVVIKDESILAIVPSASVAAHYQPDRRFVLAQHAVIPGLVNAHTHAAMTLLRGLADDKALMEWLQSHIWPAELKFVSNEFVHDGTLIACAEMLRGGVTCFNDMYFFPGAAAQAVLRAGIRASLGMIVVEFRSPYASDADDYLHKGLKLRDEQRDEGRLSFCMAPHAPYTVSDASLEKVATYAGELDVPVHIHLHETLEEIRDSLATHQVRPIRRLQKLGLLGPGLIAVHAVHLEPGEMALLAEHACHVAHCPSSNLKLASGVAPIEALRRTGVSVGLGTDGAASNNRLDLMGEMRLAALLAKGLNGDPTALPANAVLQMATLEGARSLGLDQRIGSLKPGKRADITAVRLSGVELSPCYDPLSHLAYVAGRQHVTHVWVDGELLVQDGALTLLDEEELVAKAAYWQEKIKSRDRA